MEILLLKKLLSGIWGGRKSMRGMGAGARCLFVQNWYGFAEKVSSQKDTFARRSSKKNLKTFKNLF